MNILLSLLEPLIRLLASLAVLIGAYFSGRKDERTKNIKATNTALKTKEKVASDLRSESPADRRKRLRDQSK